MHTFIEHAYIQIRMLKRHLHHLFNLPNMPPLAAETVLAKPGRIGK